MAEALFDLVILHHTSDKSVENLVQELLQLLGKAGDPYLEYKLSEALLFEQSSSAILDSVNLTEGELYQGKFRQLKVETELRPTLQLVEKEQTDSEKDVEQYVCPACQHTQPKETTEDAMNACNKCGVVGEKLARNKRKEEIFSTEKRKLEQNKTKEMKEAAVRAHTEDEAAMRKEAQEKLGLGDKKNTVGILVGIGAIAAIGVGSFFIANTLMSTPEEEADTTALEANHSPETDKQPLINIQSGNGSIVVNETPQSDTPNGGTSGSKGSTGQITENGAGIEAGATAAAQTNQSEMTTREAANTGSQTSEQPNTAATTATDSITPENQQLAALTGSTSPENQQLTALTDPTSPENQQPTALSLAKQNTVNGNAIKQEAAKNNKAPSALSKIITPPAELDVLNTILSATHAPEYFFDELNKKQFAEHQVRLQRLLKLGKPELALIFAESMEDPYPTSLMVLDIAKHAAKTGNNELFADLLLSMKALASQGSTVPQKAMLTASLSQVYDFAGEQSSAQALLEKSVELLEDPKVSLAERCQLLAQIERNHRELGNKGGADLIAEKIANFAASLSDKDYVYSSRAYTHLAATSLTKNNQDDAEAWLNQIPMTDARQYLIAQMESISAAVDKAENQ